MADGQLESIRSESLYSKRTLAFGRYGLVLGPIVGAFGEKSSHVDFLADVIADALTAEHLSYYGNGGSKAA